MSVDILKARQEVHKSLSMCDFCTRKIAISFIADLPTTFIGDVKMKSWFVFSTLALFGIVAGQWALLASFLIKSSSVDLFVASLHIVGYGTMSFFKCLLLWFKRDMFRQVVNDLVELWPVSIKDEDAAVLKRRSLTALRYFHFWYVVPNLLGVTFYNITPITLYLYRICRGIPADIGYVWAALYPIDKTKPYFHEFIYIFECFSGVAAVWAQLGADLLFTAMASHISMLLQLLQVRIRNLAYHPATRKITEITEQDKRRGGSTFSYNSDNIDCYDEIVAVIKIHQRLISYSQSLEDVFAMVNLVTILLSSVNICCVVFNIVLIESWMDMSNKLYLGAAVTQVGIICWYADEIYRASIGVANAVYESGWYNTDPRCRRALLVMLQRSQKPLYFTAMKFRNITMTTYTSILTTSYSYFTLLYTMYKD